MEPLAALKTQISLKTNDWKVTMFQKSLVPFTGKQLSKKKKMNIPKAGWAGT